MQENNLYLIGKTAMYCVLYVYTMYLYDTCIPSHVHTTYILYTTWLKNRRHNVYQMFYLYIFNFNKCIHGTYTYMADNEKYNMNRPILTRKVEYWQSNGKV